MAIKRTHHTEYVGYCQDCGKKSYSTRKRAKAALKLYHPGEKNLAVYQCGEYFHYGHLRYSVVKGWNPR